MSLLSPLNPYDMQLSLGGMEPQTTRAAPSKYLTGCTINSDNRASENSAPAKFVKASSRLMSHHRMQQTTSTESIMKNDVGSGSVQEASSSVMEHVFNQNLAD